MFSIKLFMFAILKTGTYKTFISIQNKMNDFDFNNKHDWQYVQKIIVLSLLIYGISLNGYLRVI